MPEKYICYSGRAGERRRHRRPTQLDILTETCRGAVFTHLLRRLDRVLSLRRRPGHPQRWSHCEEISRRRSCLPVLSSIEASCAAASTTRYIHLEAAHSHVNHGFITSISSTRFDFRSDLAFTKKPADQKRQLPGVFWESAPLRARR